MLLANCLAAIMGTPNWEHARNIHNSNSDPSYNFFCLVNMVPLPISRVGRSDDRNSNNY